MAGARPQWKALIVLLAVVACDYGQVTLVAPAGPRVGPLTLLVQADSEDAAPARELGWSSGIPDAVVTLTAQDSTVAPQTGRTDAGGRVSFPQVVAGGYAVEAHRWLNAAELGRLVPGEDVIGFATLAGVSHDASAGSHSVFAPASRRRSLIISEWAFVPGYKPGLGGYVFGGFLELYNNADSTVYLDGIVIGEAWSQTFAALGLTCAQGAIFSADPQGVWVHFFQALPGSGRDYPLLPGRVAVAATDAIDHRPLFPDGLDLSKADFDFSGPADVVNPGVPEAIDIGVAPKFGGHGLFFGMLSNVPLLALPVNVSTLPRQPVPGSGADYVRIPRDRVLDVLALRTTYPHGQTECPLLVHPNFDRREARLIGNDGDFVRSVARKVAYVRADGRKILQHTRTSAADLFLSARTPGVLP
jgi:hypothetical protein